MGEERQSGYQKMYFDINPFPPARVLADSQTNEQKFLLQ